jgi:hypothetical protein
MGAYSPAPLVTPALHDRIMREVIEPTLRGLRDDGNPYLGFLYAGLMIAADGTPNVLEFNCRFGDPEAQPILMRLESDLTELCESALAGTLDPGRVRWDPRAALGVVMAAGGYPDAYRQGDPIRGLDAAARSPGKVFHAGTRAVGAAGTGVAGTGVAGAGTAGAGTAGTGTAGAGTPADGAQIVTSGARAVRRGFGRHRRRRSSAGLRTGARDFLGADAIPPRHRLPRHRARSGPQLSHNLLVRQLLRLEGSPAADHSTRRRVK